MKNFNLLNMNQGLTQFQPPIKNINESEYANYESTINVLDEKTIDIFPKIYYMKMNYLILAIFINIIMIIIKCILTYIQKVKGYGHEKNNDEYHLKKEN